MLPRAANTSNLSARCVVVAIALCGAASPAFSATEIFCGMGPPPGTATFAQYNSRQETQRVSLGYVLVCEATLDRFRFSDHARPQVQSRRKVAFVTTDLSNTIFSALESIGVISDHFSDAGALSLRQVFKTRDGSTVSAFEWDMAAAGGSVRWPSEGEKISVLGNAARRTTLRTTSGKTYSSLAWTAGGRYLEVSMSSDFIREDENQLLLGFAEALETAGVRRR